MGSLLSQLGTVATSVLKFVADVCEVIVAQPLLLLIMYNKLRKLKRA